MIAPLCPVNLRSGAPNAVSAANAWGSSPGAPYRLNTSFHFSSVPFGCITSANAFVFADGGLWNVPSLLISLSPIINLLFLSAQPNCVLINSAFPLYCNSLINDIKNAIS